MVRHGGKGGAARFGNARDSTPNRHSQQQQQHQRPSQHNGGSSPNRQSNNQGAGASPQRRSGSAGGGEGSNQNKKNKSVTVTRPTQPGLKKLETPDLPINEARPAIVKMVRENPAIVLVGETGSGKTTQVPQYLLDDVVPHMGDGNGMVIVTQPRRVAAISVAQYVAKLRGSELGHEVGYAVRFDDKTKKGKTRLKFMTDGILLKELLANKDLPQYSVIILDEAHERTLHGDVLFGLLKQLLFERRSTTLKIVVMSATLNTDQFSKFWNRAPIGLVKGRTHPVDIYHSMESQADYLDATINLTVQVHLDEPEGGDILVFLTGQEVIENCAEVLEERRKLLPQTDKGFHVVTLFSAMSPEAQMMAFEKTPGGERKIILATNIAETSITIEGIKYVIDCGLLKARQYNEATGMEMLLECPVSQAQAKQRTGRAGRLTHGKCFRLYTEETFEDMASNPVPEILRCSLVSVVLQMKAMGINDLIAFDFMDKPSSLAIIKSLEQLWRLGALEKRDPNKAGGKSGNTLPLTKLGRMMADFPIDPPGAKALITAVGLGCAVPVARILAMLSTENVILSGYYGSKGVGGDVSKNSTGGGDRGDRTLHKASIGDHITLLNIFTSFKKACVNASNQQRKEWCDSHNINYKQMQRVEDTEVQLLDLLKQKAKSGCLESKLPPSVTTARQSSAVDNGDDEDDAMPLPESRESFLDVFGEQNPQNAAMSDYAEVRRAFCSGYFLQTAYFSKPDDCYMDNITRQRVSAHPSSVVFSFLKNRKPELVLYNSLLVTKKNFMKELLSIRPEWLHEACPSLFPKK